MLTINLRRIPILCYASIVFLLFSNTLKSQNFEAEISSTLFSICGAAPTVTVSLENNTPDAITFDSVCIFFPQNFS